MNFSSLVHPGQAYEIRNAEAFFGAGHRRHVPGRFGDLADDGAGAPSSSRLSGPSVIGPPFNVSVVIPAGSTVPWWSELRYCDRLNIYAPQASAGHTDGVAYKAMFPSDDDGAQESVTSRRLFAFSTCLMLSAFKDER